MSNDTKIEWAERTWNITSGCTRVSEGCRHCYAERLVSTRLRHLPQNQGVVRGDKDGVGHWTGLVKCHEEMIALCEDRDYVETLKRRVNRLEHALFIAINSINDKFELANFRDYEPFEVRQLMLETYLNEANGEI